ncbi:MAG TPA: hypothetical protein VHH11_01080 [Gammaproteobacteria bacterium]|jgi:hypothetical protein|nr:hypothetical protein [Gammaproteobacteria bacterium]
MLPQHDTAAPVRAWLAGATTRFAADNRDLVAATDSLLARTIGAGAQHARLLNTLSLLEHMGSHKIMATQHRADVDQATLRHLAEESHHAYFMKRQAEKTAGRPLEYVPQDLLAPAAARMYFQRLEAATVSALGDACSPRAAYLYMSMIVEFRALWFYGIHQAALQRARHALSLKRVIGEERNHLTEMAARLDTDGDLSEARVAALLTRERALYARLLTALERAVA